MFWFFLKRHFDFFFSSSPQDLNFLEI
jgi:hypothetical protein